MLATADRRLGVAVSQAGTLACAAALLLAACAKVSSPMTPVGGSDAAVDRGSGPGPTGQDGAPAGDRPGGGGDALISTTDGCVPVTCTPPGGQYCGDIGNGCRGTLSCPATCGANQVCEENVCVGDQSCVARTSCDVAGGGRYCGNVGNGCGRALACGDCPGGQNCQNGVCVPANCMPLTCNITGGGKYCEQIGDGCGGTLECGGCTAPQTCGGGGTPQVCGTTAANCTTPVSCTPMGGQYCGMIGNGCGGRQDCGACANGMPCGTGDLANICPGSSRGCTRLQCQIETCTPTTRTSISGIVYDPAGKNPLYNVVVYVPNTTLSEIPTGVSCDRCSTPVSGQPVAAALTNAQGRFRIENAPSGSNIPLVIQVGKWRRQVMLPEVRPCQDNVFMDANMMRLPRNQSEGHLPKIAVSNGHSDALDCLLRKIGIADSEFTTDAGSGRVHLFLGGAGGSDSQGATMLTGSGAIPDAYTALFPTYAKLMGYDILILQCEGSRLDAAKMPYLVNVRRFADNGGRIFATHRQLHWVDHGLAPWPAVANWGPGNNETLEQTMVTGLVDTSFPKGMALADWLMTVQASPTRGQITLNQLNDSILSVNPPTQRWIYTTSPLALAPYATFNTPLDQPAANQCGRVAMTDVHVGSGSGSRSTPDMPFPAGCGSAVDLTAQEKALEFMFFDLSSCVAPDPGSPMAPIVPPPGAAGPPPAAVPPPPPPPPPRID